jgi:hypothetical protein
MNAAQPAPRRKSDLLDSVQKGLLLGAAIVALMLSPAGLHQRSAPRVAGATVRSAPSPLADFGQTVPSGDVRLLANWTVYTRDHQTMSFIIVEVGESSSRHEDVIWVDYNAAVSMHRVVNLVPAERRLQRLASADPAEHRISYGCINLPRVFYEAVVILTVRSGGAVIYVLPETRSAEQVFGSYDVSSALKLAQR